MNFDINSFFKLFGSIYKIAFILFLCGLFLIFSSEEIREVFFLKEFVKTFGVYIGITTLISGVITIIYIFEMIYSWFKKKSLFKLTSEEIIKNLSRLSIDEKKVLAYFLSSQTATSDLGIEYENLQEPKSIGSLMAKGYIYKTRIGLQPFYHVEDIVWDILQENWQRILYEDEFKQNN